MCVSEKKSKCVCKSVCEGQLVLQAHLGPPGSFFSAAAFYWPRLTAMKWQEIYCCGAYGSEGRVRTSSLFHSLPSSSRLFMYLSLSSIISPSLPAALGFHPSSLPVHFPGIPPSSFSFFYNFLTFLLLSHFLSHYPSIS